MNNKILYLVVAASGTGKDYIVDKICEDFGKKKVISRTTRTPRYDGENTHLFVSNKMADDEFDNAVAKTVFHGNRYYTTINDLIDKDFYIIDPAGVKSMKHKEKFNTVTIFIKSNVLLTAWHMLKRGDNLKDVIGRIKNDRKEFKGFKGELNFKSSKKMYDYFREEFINEKDEFARSN